MGFLFVQKKRGMMALIFGSPEANRIAQADRQRQRQIDAGLSTSWRSPDGWQLVDLFLTEDELSLQRWQNDGGNQHKQRQGAGP